jgi:hypothetical protein
MNRNKLMFRIIGGLLTLLFLVGCTTTTQTPTPTLTLTINENECTLDAPETIPNGNFTVKFVINEQEPNETGYILATLEDGKTIEDLNAWSSADQPPWVIIIHRAHEPAGGTHIYSYDPTQFTQNARYDGGPYYLVCFRNDPDTGTMSKIGAFGPIEVK